MAERRKILVGVRDLIDSEILGMASFKESEGVAGTGDAKCVLSCQCFAGRKHEGDENGKTSYRCGILTFIEQDPLIFTKYELVYSDVRISPSQKESLSDFQCSPSSVIVGRHHKGDENGQTYYYYRDIWVKKLLASDHTKIKLSCEEPDKKECKESAGEWMQSPYTEDRFQKYRAMTGRKHVGDENGKTYYEFKMFYFEVDEKGDIINPNDSE